MLAGPPHPPPAVVRRRDRRRAEGDARGAEGGAAMIGGQGGPPGGYFTGTPTRGLHARGAGRYFRTAAVLHAGAAAGRKSGRSRPTPSGDQQRDQARPPSLRSAGGCGRHPSPAVANQLNDLVRGRQPTSLFFGIDLLPVNENVQRAWPAQADTSGNLQLAFNALFQAHGLSLDIVSIETALDFDFHGGLLKIIARTSTSRGAS